MLRLKCDLKQTLFVMYVAGAFCLCSNVTAQPSSAFAEGVTGAKDPQATADYILGVNDQVVIRAYEMDEISGKPIRVDSQGNLNLPVLGAVQALGLTAERLELLLAGKLKQYVRVPQVSVTVIQFRATPVFLMGAFRSPGIYSQQSHRTLVELLSLSGGLQENASRRLSVTRKAEYGPIPLPGAAINPARGDSTVYINLKTLADGSRPEENLELEPYDVITAERAESIYVTGKVTRAGTIDLGGRESISVAKLITMSGGLAPDALEQDVKVLRPVLNTSRRAEISVNMKRIFSGLDSDFPVFPNDIVYVPMDGKRAFWTRAGAFSVGLAPTLLLLGVR